MPGFSTVWGEVLPLVTLSPTSNAYPAGKHLGNARGLSAIEPDLTPSNIIYGIQIFGVSGTHGYLDRWIPVTIDSLAAAGIVIINQSISKNVPLTAPDIETTGDAPSDMISRLLSTVATADAEDIQAIAQSDNEDCPVTKGLDLQIVVGGAEADDGGAFTDETAAAQNATANDMNLLPATPAENDAYYFGHDNKFDKLILTIGTQGVGTWTITWEYYDTDTTWEALAGVTDGTTGFTNSAGVRNVTFTRPAAWATVAVNGVTKYWIRARVSSYTSKTTQPRGSQAWVGINV